MDKNTKDRSELGYLLAGDFILNSKGQASWKTNYPVLKEIREEARRLGSSRIFYDSITVTMA